MKTQKLFVLLVSTLILGGCNFSSTTSVPTQNDGKVIINGFDNNNDLYRSKQLLDKIHYGVDCTLDIDKTITHSGNGSLHITYNTSVYGQIYQRNALSPIKDKDMSDVAKVGGWFYNDNDFDTTIKLNVVGKETEIISTYEVEFPSKEWINPEYVLNKISMNAVQDDVRGFSFKIGACKSYPASFYADEMYVVFGAKTTEEDDKYLSKINELINEIDSLPEIIRPTDTANITKCKDIANKYSEIPVVYRPAITNYQIYTLALQTYIDCVADQTATDSDVIAYHFDNCFGLGQASFSYTHTQFQIGFSDEHKFMSEEGSLKLSLEGNVEWASFYATSAVNMQDYDYIEFSVYNDTPSQIAFCLTWDSAHYVEPKSWETFKISTNYSAFAPTYMIEWEITSCDPSYYGDSNPHATVGDVYISQVTLHRASASEFINLLDKLPKTITYQNEAEVEKVREYYALLHKDEKAKINQQDYDRLLNAEKAVLISYFDQLSTIIDALPSVDGMQVYNGTHINKAYSIYSVMNDTEKNSYLSKPQMQKIEALYQAFTNLYKVAISATNLTGENIGMSWDVRANATKRLDATYGDVVDYNLSSVPNGGLNGAFEFTFDKVDLSNYKEITFYVNPAHNDTLYISRSSWRGGEGQKGYAYSQSLTANTWNKVTVDANDFDTCSYIEFYFSTEVSINDTYSFTSFYGVLRD